ncbi:amidohydrolase family protein [Geodermatophilus sp. URMC 64]
MAVDARLTAVRALPDLLELAAHPNVAIKFSGAPSMSQQPYPFEDLWPDLRRIVDAFRSRRLMWGTDISRFYGRIGFRSFPEFSSEDEFAYRDGIAPELASPDRARVVPHSYAEALFHLRDSHQLTADDKEWRFGRTAQTLLRWPADPRPATHMAP